MHLGKTGSLLRWLCTTLNNIQLDSFFFLSRCLYVMLNPHAVYIKMHSAAIVFTFHCFNELLALGLVILLPEVIYAFNYCVSLHNVISTPFRYFQCHMPLSCRCLCFLTTHVHAPLSQHLLTFCLCFGCSPDKCWGQEQQHVWPMYVSIPNIKTPHILLMHHVYHASDGCPHT